MSFLLTRSFSAVHTSPRWGLWPCFWWPSTSLCSHHTAGSRGFHSHTPLRTSHLRRSHYCGSLAGWRCGRSLGGSSSCVDWSWPRWPRTTRTPPLHLDRLSHIRAGTITEGHTQTHTHSQKWRQTYLHDTPKTKLFRTAVKHSCNVIWIRDSFLH